MATEVVIPILGITVETGIIVEWLKKEGDPVRKGEILFVVETDKVTTEVESPATGILARILLPEGEKVSVLTVVAVITKPGEKLPAKYLNVVDEISVTRQAENESLVQNESAADFAKPKESALISSDEPVRIIPAARKLAKQKGLDITNIPATGPDGVILLSDVEAVLATTGLKISTLAKRHAEKNAVSLKGIKGSGVRGRIMRHDVQQVLEADKTPALGKIISMNRMRQVIARRMTESAFTAPQIHFFSEIRLDPLFIFKKEITPDCEQQFHLRLSINDFLIKAAALSIIDFPILNATIRDQEIHIQPNINIGLAVALPDGLVVPAITDADKVGLADIALQRLDLVKRARLGKLTQEELERGTFTISSLAQYDITHFTAILNPPQSGILTIGNTRDRLYLKDGSVKVIKIATVGLSVDHRIIDGVIAADFLQDLKHKIEKPAFTFLHSRQNGENDV